MKQLDFITKLSKKEKTVASVALIFVLLAFFDRVILESILTTIKSVENQVKIQESVIKKDLKILSQKNMIKEQDRQYSSYAVDAKSQEDEISIMLKDIETIAGQSSVNLSEVKPADIKSEKLLKKYTLSLTCEATIEQMADFMFRLENSRNIFSIETYSLASKDRERGILRAVMTISKVVIVS